MAGELEVFFSFRITKKIHQALLEAAGQPANGQQKNNYTSLARSYVVRGLIQDGYLERDSNETKTQTAG